MKKPVKKTPKKRTKIVSKTEVIEKLDDLFTLDEVNIDDMIDSEEIELTDKEIQETLDSGACVFSSESHSEIVKDLPKNGELLEIQPIEACDDYIACQQIYNSCQTTDSLETFFMKFKFYLLKTNRLSNMLTSKNVMKFVKEHENYDMWEVLNYVK